MTGIELLVLWAGKAVITKLAAAKAAAVVAAHATAAGHLGAAATSVHVAGQSLLGAKQAFDTTHPIIHTALCLNKARKMYKKS